jgi:hypothetical protein
VPAKAYVHEAFLSLGPGADTRAPGAAVTVALCGTWEHEGPCHWPHHTSTETQGGKLVVRTVFAIEPSDEHTVREKIRNALRAGELVNGAAKTTWTLLSEAPASPTPEETARANRMLSG